MNTGGSLSNGAKLDDCHSTFYALADLKGIKWLKFTSQTSGLSDDPVLITYSKCLQKDILAAWRQVLPSKKPTKTDGPLKIQNDKELYIFWWGEESMVEEISNNKALQEVDKGSWEEGLTYDCRTMLYKSMHNLIERCLWNDGFVRINRWFTKPLTHEGDDISDHFSFSFSFFLHGEQIVCATVELAKHTNVCRLTGEFLHKTAAASSSATSSPTAQQDVILCPYGLTAKLTGVFYRTHDSVSKKLLEEWRPYYPIHTLDSLVQDDGCHGDRFASNLPPVVEIVFCGIHMNYPSSYILVPCDQKSNNSNASSSIIEPAGRSSVNQVQQPLHHHQQQQPLQDLTSPSFIKTPASNILNDGVGLTSPSFMGDYNNDMGGKIHSTIPLPTALVQSSSANSKTNSELPDLSNKNEEQRSMSLVSSVISRVFSTDCNNLTQATSSPAVLPPVKEENSQISQFSSGCLPKRFPSMDILTHKFAKPEDNKPSQQQQLPLHESSRAFHKIPNDAETTATTSSVMSQASLLVAAITNHHLDQQPPSVTSTIVEHHKSMAIVDQHDQQQQHYAAAATSYPIKGHPQQFAFNQPQQHQTSAHDTTYEQQRFKSNGANAKAGRMSGWKMAERQPNQPPLPPKFAPKSRCFDDIDDKLTQSCRKLTKWKTYHLKSPPVKRSVEHTKPVFGAALDPLESFWGSGEQDLLVNKENQRAFELLQSYGFAHKRPCLWKSDEPHSLNTKIARSERMEAMQAAGVEASSNPTASDHNINDPTIITNNQSPYYRQIYTAAGKLAGMDVAPDPYEFEDDPEDDSPGPYNAVGTPGGSSSGGRRGESGSLTPGNYPPSSNQQDSIWSAPSSQAVRMTTANNATSQLEQLLMYPSSSSSSQQQPANQQHITTSSTLPGLAAASPAASSNLAAMTTASVTRINPTSSSSSAIGQDNLDFTMDDLRNHQIFDIDGDSGVPTPPTNGNDHHLAVQGARSSSSAATFNPPPPLPPTSSSSGVGNNYGAGDMGHMFPTPPSLETCQPTSPDATVTIVPSSAPSSVSSGSAIAAAAAAVSSSVDSNSSRSAAPSRTVADLCHVTASLYPMASEHRPHQTDHDHVHHHQHHHHHRLHPQKPSKPHQDINTIAERGLNTVRSNKFPSSSTYQPLHNLPSFDHHSPSSSPNQPNKSPAALTYVPSVYNNNNQAMGSSNGGGMMMNAHTPQYLASQPSTPYMMASYTDMHNLSAVITRPYPSPAPSTPMAPTPSSARGGNTSIRTPSSCQPPHSSPRTPKTPMLRSIEQPLIDSPASSFATQNSHRGIHSSARPDQVDANGTLALSINLLLSDTMFNVFQDRSFDLCTLCVCSDQAFNLTALTDEPSFGAAPPDSNETRIDWEPANGCVCGFSPTRNRMSSIRAGLFLEDELEICGLEFEKEILTSATFDDACEYDKDTLKDLVDIALQTSCSPFNPAYFSQQSQNQVSTYTPNASIEKEEWSACSHALNCSLSLVDFQPIKCEPDVTENPVHKWNRTQSDALSCASTSDIYRLLVLLKPLLQDAIQRKRANRNFNSTQHVDGPLTWREFCKKAGKEADSQPVPSIVVGFSHGWASVSPSSIKHWDKLLLEPYSAPRDLVYLTLLQDSPQLCEKSLAFFRQLASLYETCRLGRMWPLTNDGLVRAKLSSASAGGNPSSLGEEVERFCDQVLNSKYFATSLSEFDHKCLRSYIQACLTDLARLVNSYVTCGLSATNKHRTEERVVKSIFESPSSSSITSDSQLHSTMVVFMIDPFQGTKSRELMRCFARLRRTLNEPFRNRLILQIVPVEKVLRMSSWNAHESVMQYMRTLAFDTYVQCRHAPPRNNITRSMTGFGPASEKLFTQPGCLVPKRNQTYTPLYVLNNPRDSINIMSSSTSSNAFGGGAHGSSSSKRHNSTVGGGGVAVMVKGSNISSTSDVLFVSYCLSHDQRFLLATATDHCGEFMESSCINISVPPRRLATSRKKRVSVRGGAIGKLWQFCVDITKRSSTKVWRIVIGKLGRASHGELRDWARFLNRKSLLTSRVSPSNKCQQCVDTSSSENYRIASACLISMEPDGSMMIMPNVVQANNFGRPNSSQSQQLRTPEDTSSTSICVVATSATTQDSASHLQTGQQLFEDVGLFENELGIDNINDYLPPFNDNSMNMGASAYNDDMMRGSSAERLLSHDGEPSEDKLLEQPLSVGYMVSTAPCGPLPDWFWATCPTARNRTPVFLRLALHIRTSVVDGQTLSFLSQEQHPLDSNNTVVLLKYVLEVYNTLSWLTRDLKTNDRQTCLPIQCLTLLQLYHTLQNLMTKQHSQSYSNNNNKPRQQSATAASSTSTPPTSSTSSSQPPTTNNTLMTSH